MKRLLLLSAICVYALLTQAQNLPPSHPQDSLVSVLAEIWELEQLPIRKRDSLGRVHGYESEQFNKQDDIYHKAHDINEKRIKTILKTGWPEMKVIGEQGNQTICNVLQHSSLEVRVHYIPLMKQAVIDKNLQPRLLARAEDRIATDRGELQIYGGQIKYYPETKSFDVWPILDPVNVDKRRASIGMGPIAEALASRRHPLKWDLEAQIQRTKDFLKAKGQSNN